MPASQPVPRGHSPILVFDDLGKVNVSEVFKDILPAIESRGINITLQIPLGMTAYWHSDCPITSFILKLSCIEWCGLNLLLELGNVLSSF